MIYILLWIYLSYIGFGSSSLFDCDFNRSHRSGNTRNQDPPSGSLLDGDVLGVMIVEEDEEDDYDDTTTTTTTSNLNWKKATTTSSNTKVPGVRNE